MPRTAAAKQTLLARAGGSGRRRQGQPGYRFVVTAGRTLGRPIACVLSDPGCNDVVMEADDLVAAHESRELNEVVERLLQRFPDMPEERVRSAVIKAHQEFVNNPIRDFVPVFVERSARAELSQGGAAAPDKV